MNVAKLMIRKGQKRDANRYKQGSRLRNCFPPSFIVHQTSACDSQEYGLDVRRSAIIEGLNMRTHEFSHFIP